MIFFVSYIYIYICIIYIISWTTLMYHFHPEADLPVPLPPPLHPGELRPCEAEDFAPLFPMALIAQEVSIERCPKKFRIFFQPLCLFVSLFVCLFVCAKIHALYPHHCALQWHCQAYSLLGSSHWQKGWLSLHWFDLNRSLLVVLEKDLGSFHGSGALTPATTELSNGQLWRHWHWRIC